MGWIRGKRTYIVSGLMVMVGIVNMVTGDMTVIQFFTSPDVSTLLSGLGLGTLRAGLANK